MLYCDLHVVIKQQKCVDMSRWERGANYLIQRIIQQKSTPKVLTKNIRFICNAHFLIKYPFFRKGNVPFLIKYFVFIYLIYICIDISLPSSMLWSSKQNPSAADLPCPCMETPLAPHIYERYIFLCSYLHILV